MVVSSYLPTTPCLFYTGKSLSLWYYEKWNKTVYSKSIRSRDKLCRNPWSDHLEVAIGEGIIGTELQKIGSQHQRRWQNGPQWKLRLRLWMLTLRCFGDVRLTTATKHPYPTDSEPLNPHETKWPIHFATAKIAMGSKALEPAEVSASW